MVNITICINDDCGMSHSCYRHQAHWVMADGEEYKHYYPSAYTGDCEYFAAKDSRVYCTMLKKRDAKKLVTAGLDALSVEVGKQLRAKNRQRQQELKLRDRKKAERAKNKSRVRLSKAREAHLNER